MSLFLLGQLQVTGAEALYADMGSFAMQGVPLQSFAKAASGPNDGAGGPKRYDVNAFGCLENEYWFTLIL